MIFKVEELLTSFFHGFWAMFQGKGSMNYYKPFLFQKLTRYDGTLGKHVVNLRYARWAPTS